MANSLMTFGECSLCTRKFDVGKVWNLCDCGGPLLVRYALERIGEAWSRDTLASAPHSMWRYAPVLPVRHTASVVSLGEGMTPLLPATRAGARIGSSALFIKDEGLNPTGSCKARGLSCAVSMCLELGIRKLAIPSAGSAAGALAAYSAAAGLDCHVFMPADVPQANFVECSAFGARVTLVPGLIGDCARLVARLAPREGWFHMSTLSEPYRIEGAKTAGYEIAEQMGWELPDAIFYPARGGVGIAGMWKAFAELETLGWISSQRPKMIAVQASGEGLILKAVRESGGTAVAVPGAERLDAGIRLASEEGVFVSPEGAACVVAAERLLREGFLKRDDKIVICNTASGLKYLEAYSTRFPRNAAGETDKLGGLITPR
ncbi:MAG: threonine synthase [Acidobacteriota bacterium]|nr:threonine synthase [Acidobacteriota bacterium]